MAGLGDIYNPNLGQIDETWKPPPPAGLGGFMSRLPGVIQSPQMQLAMHLLANSGWQPGSNQDVGGRLGRAGLGFGNQQFVQQSQQERVDAINQRTQQAAASAANREAGANARTQYSVGAANDRSTADRESAERRAKVQADARIVAAKLRASGLDTTAERTRQALVKAVQDANPDVPHADIVNALAGLTQVTPNTLGSVFSTDELRRTATELPIQMDPPLGQPTPAQPTPPFNPTQQPTPGLGVTQPDIGAANDKPMSLWDAAAHGTGIGSAITQGANIGLGSLPGDASIDEQTTKARTALKVGSESFVEAFIKSTHKNQAEQDRLRKIFSGPSWDKPTSVMRAEMTQMNDELKILRSNYEAEMAKPGLGLPKQQEYRAKIKDIEALISRLGVPSGDTAGYSIER